MTTPSSVAAELRRIAQAIDNSRNPSPQLVAGAVRSLLSSIAAPSIEITSIDAEIRGTVDGEEFECTLGWDPSTGDVADFDQISGAEVNPTDLLSMIQINPLV